MGWSPKECPGHRHCPHLSLPDEVLELGLARDSRAGPEAVLEPRLNFGATVSVFPRPLRRQLPAPYPLPLLGLLLTLTFSGSLTPLETPIGYIILHLEKCAYLG